MAIAEGGLGEVGAFQSAIYFNKSGNDEWTRIEVRRGWKPRSIIHGPHFGHHTD